MYLSNDKWIIKLTNSETYFPPFFFESISKASFEYPGALMRIYQCFGSIHVSRRETRKRASVLPKHVDAFNVGYLFGIDQ